MKALTIWQPWASLVAIGAKSCETRGWPTHYRGPLLIHAGVQWNRDQAVICRRPMFREALEPHFGRAFDLSTAARAAAADVLPLGAVVAVARLVACSPTWPQPEGLDEREREFGDWGPGRYAFRLEDVRALAGAGALCLVLTRDDAVTLLGRLGRMIDETWPDGRGGGGR